MTGPYEIARARPDEVPLLPGIERRAGARFEQLAETAHLPAFYTPLEDFEEGQRAGRLWVARTGGAPVGFALAVEGEDDLHLQEVDVLPEHGRHGLGTRLVEAVCAHARARGQGVTLTTFRRVPWNAPFYARLGFQELAEEELTPSLRRHRAEEEGAGLPREQRCVMRWRPGPPRDGVG